MENQNVVDASLAGSENINSQALSKTSTSEPSVVNVKLLIENDGSGFSSLSNDTSIACTLIPFVNGLSNESGGPRLDEITIDLDFTDNHPNSNPVVVNSDNSHCMISESEGVFNKEIQFQSVELGAILPITVTWRWGSHEYGPAYFQVTVEG